MRLLRHDVARRLLLAALAVGTAIAVAGVPLAGAAAKSASTGVVVIQTSLANGNGTGAATGMVLTSSGEVLTNNHVVRGATQLRVRVPDTGRTYRAQVLGYSVSADVALLKLRGVSGLETVSIGNSSSVRLGDDVSAVGNAGGTGLTTKEGAITALGRTITVGDGPVDSTRLAGLFQTDADLRPGDSGGPLLDGSGRVIGMNAAVSVELGARSTTTEGYAIPINRATSIVGQIESDRPSVSVHIGATPFLGVSVARATSFPGTVTSGVLVAGVKAGSPAARAGVQAGDLIVSLNGNPVPTYAKLVSRLLRWHPGDKARIGWLDELGGRSSASITLVSGPPQ